MRIAGLKRWTLLAAVCASLLAGCKNRQNEAPKPSTNSNVKTPQVAAATSRKLESVTPTDAEVWTEILNGFQNELQPDKLDSQPGYAPYTRKHIERVWRVGDAELVLLEKQTENKDDQDWNRLFELYNYNSRTKKKSQITAKWPFWLWEFRQLSHFESGSVPDITFQTMSCTECEPEIIVSSVQFDESSGKWRLRKWLDNAEGVVVGDTDVGVDGDVEEYMALDGIADFRKNGRDEIAVWTHYRDVDEKDPGKKLPAVTTLILYGYENGAPVETQVKEEVEFKQIKKILCTGKSQTDACRLDK